MTNALNHDGRSFPLDAEGFLQDDNEWIEPLSELLAERESVTLNREHWEIIRVLREFYRLNGQHPVIRVITTAMARSLGLEKGTIKYFHTLFPGGIHQAYRIAGLPMKQSCC